MLMVCTIVGLYFGYEDYKKRKHAKKHRRGSEAQDYLLGSRNMKIFPVAMSLVASCISGIALLGKISIKMNFINSSLLILGTSSEIYLYGYQYAFILIGYTIAAIIVHYTVIPLYHELQITSAYEVALFFFSIITFLIKFTSYLSSIFKGDLIKKFAFLALPCTFSQHYSGCQ